jgi:hypothetical protein
MNTASNVPFLVIFFATYMDKLTHSNMLRFAAHFHTVFQKMLMATAHSDENMHIVLLAFQEMAKKRCLHSYHFSFLTHAAIGAINHPNPLVSYAARSILRAMPHMFCVMAAATVPLQLKGFKTPATTRQVGMAPRVYRPKPTPAPEGPIQTTCAAAVKCAHGPVQTIVRLGQHPTVAVHHSTNEIAELQLSQQAKLRLVSNVRTSDRIVNMESIGTDRLAVTLPTRIEFRDLDRFDSFQGVDVGGPIYRSKLLHSGFLCLASKSDLSLMSLAGRVVLQYDIRGRNILNIESWKSSSFFSVLDSQFVTFVDPRVGLPIICHKCQAAIECIAIGSRKCVIGSKAGYMFYDLMSKWKPYFRISRVTDFAMAARAGLVLCDQGGTFFCDPAKYSRSMFDASRGRVLTPVDGVLELPIEMPVSLHGHVFPVSAGTSSRSLCITGDIAGYVHVWSAFAERFLA